jgi:phosphatidylglycerophosphatase A
MAPGHGGRRLGLPLGHPAVLVATWFGTGFLPRAPGSWASLAALPLAWLIRWQWGVPGLAVAAAMLFGIGWWAAGVVAGASGLADPGAIVVDEVAGQWLSLLSAPLDPLLYAVGFVLFRLFDIWKPWPVSSADRHLGGGFGIMLDDALAAVYAALLLLAIAGVAGAYR